MVMLQLLSTDEIIATEFWLLCNADPEKDNTDGFFVAVFQRSSSQG